MHWVVPFLYIPFLMLCPFCNHIKYGVCTNACDFCTVYEMDMNTKKIKDKSIEDDELELLINRVDIENAALNKILDRFQSGGNAKSGGRTGKPGDKVTKSKSI